MDNNNTASAAPAAKKFRKGDLVTYCGFWNDWSGSDHDLKSRARQQEMWFRFCTVISWGKKQGALRDTVTGETIRVGLDTQTAKNVLPGHSEELACEWAERTTATHCDYKADMLTRAIERGPQGLNEEYTAKFYRETKACQVAIDQTRSGDYIVAELHTLSHALGR